MNKILERYKNNDKYDTWFVVKQNYSFDVTKYFIRKISEFTRSSYKGSFGSFIENSKDNFGNPSLKSYRNVKTLIDLNITTNHIMNGYPKYHDYDIATSVLESLDDDEKLKIAISNRMLEKEYFVVDKSNKASNVSTKLRVIKIPIYLFLLEVMKKLYESSGLNFITKLEISNIVVLAKDIKEVDDVIDAINILRKDGTKIENVFKEGRFHLTLHHLEVITKIDKNKFFFDYDKICQTLKQDGKSVEKKVIEMNTDDFITTSLVRGRNSGKQAIWKGQLSKDFDDKCALCSLSHISLLRGSHIKSVKDCIRDEDMLSMFDVNNGLLLCANHDVLFDRKIIAIDPDGKVVGKTHGVLTKNMDEKFLNKDRKTYINEHYKKFLKYSGESKK